MARMNRIGCFVSLASLAAACTIMAGAAWPGGGSTPPPNPAIAYTDGGIKVMNADGTNIRTVVSLRRGDYAGFPAWSPGSTHLVYFGRFGTINGLWTVPVAGGASQLVTTTAQQPAISDWSPVAAPDGQSKIAFVDLSSPSDRDVFLVNPDGSGRINLTNSPGVYEQCVSWAPDGRHLAVARGSYEIAILEIGLVNGELAIVAESAVYARYSLTPHWANASDQLAFTVAASTGRIATLDLNDPGAMPVLVTSNAGSEERYPDFSPDDTRVVFQRLGSGGGIFTINSDGTGQVRINSRGAEPTWRRTP